MKKLIALILSLCFLLPAAVMTAGAEVGYTLALEGEGDPADLTGATTYVLPTPTAPEGKTFAGWQGTLGEADVFLPAGAEVTLTADATLTAVYVGIAMRSEPQLRLDIQGLRFLTNVSKADLTALQQYGTVGYGTLIAPKNHLKKNATLTHADLAASGELYLDVVTEGAYAENEEVLTVAGSIGHVKEKNFCRTLLAAGYLSLTYTDGSTGYVYAPIKQSDKGHYLYTHALAAFNDRAGIADATHVHQAEGGFSPYDAAQRGYLKRVLDTTVNMTVSGAASNLTVVLGPASPYYKAPFTVSYSRSREAIVIAVASGEDYRFDVDYQSLIWGDIVMEAGHGSDSDYEISADGTKLYIPHGEYSEFY